MQRQFHQDEAEEILRAAIRRSVDQGAPGTRQTPVSAERLSAMAAELGVEQDVLAAVLGERAAGALIEAEQMGEAKLREIFIGERRHEIVPHAIAFVLIQALLLGINLMTTPQVPWFFFPLIGWGIGFAIHAWLTVPTRGPAFEASFDRWRRKRIRRRKQEQEEDD